MATVITVYGSADATPPIVVAASAQSGVAPSGTTVIFNVGDPSVAAIGGVNLADITYTKTLPDATRRVAEPATNPNGWNLGAGAMIYRFDFFSTNYFVENPGSHLAIGLRCDTTTLATQPRFAGAIIGSVVGATNGSDHAPTVQLESRATGLDSADPAIRFLYPRSDIGASKLLQDGIQYRCTIYSTLTVDNQRKIRYTWEQFNTSDHGWDLLRDTGDVTDANTYLDYTQFGLAVGSNFENPAANPWTCTFTNRSVTWGPAQASRPETGSTVDRYGAKIESDLNFIGDGRTIYGKTSGGTFSQYTAYKNNQLNQATTFLAVPNGTSTQSNVGSANSSSLTNFGFSSFGMNGADAELSTIGVGSAGTPRIFVKVGTAIAGLFTTLGYNAYRGGVTAAVTALGVATTRCTGMTNLAGANALALAQSAQNMETYATAGQIGAVAGATVETVLRPIYGILSCLLKDLQERNVI